jgi:hypothetical protein
MGLCLMVSLWGACVQVREAVFCHDYKALFRLYATAPNMGRALMDMFLDRLRFAALNVIVRAFKPHVPVPFLARLLGFLAPQDSCSDSVSAARATAMSLPGSRHAVFVGQNAPRVRPRSPASLFAGHLFLMGSCSRWVAWPNPRCAARRRTLKKPPSNASSGFRSMALL